MHGLLESLGLRPDQVGAQAPERFPVRVPRGFVARMRPGDPADPLLRQVLPLAEEDAEVPGFGRDPVGDLDAASTAGVLRKYAGRALLIATGACAVHCRYCFRRHFPYAETNAAAAHWDAALREIAADPSVSEVILSGGDPLTLGTDKLAALGDGLAGITHVKRLRIHTRVPIVLPERVDEPLCAWLAGLGLGRVVVVHANHPAELDEGVGRALARLAASGAVLLNQSVLLRGVNDDAGVLAALSESLFGFGVLPYYIHMLDRAAGTAHFEVDEPRARTIMTTMRERLPGYLVPKLVREVAGSPSKLPV